MMEEIRESINKEFTIAINLFKKRNFGYIRYYQSDKDFKNTIVNRMSLKKKAISNIGIYIYTVI